MALAKEQPELQELLDQVKKLVDAMTPEQLEDMHKKQRESWLRAELQWAKDFREGKCERD